MSLSALSSALSLSSRSESSSQKRKKAGESTCDVSISGSSLSSEGVKSIPQNGSLPPNLLGNPDSATDTSSSSSFPSLDLNNSSLSQDHHIFMSMSSTSSLSFEHQGTPHTHFETAFHEYGVEAEEGTSPASTPETPLVTSRQVVLENIEYFSSLQQASSFTDNDLSTMDEPITKEVAKDVFCRREAPVKKLDIALTEDASTRHSGHKSAEKHDDEEVFDVETGRTENASAVMASQLTFPLWQRVMDRRTKLELFFMSVIVVSSSVLVLLLIVVLT